MKPEHVIARLRKVGATGTRTARRCLKGGVQVRKRGRTCTSSWSASLTQALEAQAGWLGLTPHVIERADMATFCTTEAVLFLLCDYEGFGLSALEAQMCGTPVVCPDWEALQECSAPRTVFCS